MSKRPSCAIIGAGITGATLYQNLKGQFDIQVFEKARGPGGRMSTKRLDAHRFNHGVIRFHIPEASIHLFSDSEQESILEETSCHQYMCKPYMNSLSKSRLKNAHVSYQAKVSTLLKEQDKWSLIDESQKKLGNFDIVLVTVPAPQAIEICSNCSTKSFTEVIQQLKTVEYCSTIAIYAHKGKLEHKQSSTSEYFTKLNFQHPGSIVAHKTMDYMETSLEKFKEEARNRFIEEFETSPEETYMHFWRYSEVKSGVNKPHLYLQQEKIGFFGDYFMPTGNGIVDGMLSASTLHIATCTI